ncbi:MAG: hypothetical protein LBI12_00915 [Treponema sp.]|jgi:hypothetical protein|nr:hypothetical protein [Treponema sp.]
MSRKSFLFFLLFFSVFSRLYAQGHESGNHPFVIRGEVYVDFEPIYAGFVDEEYPLDVPTASRRALKEAAMLYSAMIYGWSFVYEPGERARQIEENLEIEPVALIRYGDPSMRVTDTEIRNMQLRVWTDYHLNDSQQRRMQTWRTGMIRNAQATGYGPSSMEEYPGWLVIKKEALEDAARAALRAMLRGSERNRPKEASGFISLASFPRYFMDGGRWAVSARFRVQVNEIIPFAVH